MLLQAAEMECLVRQSLSALRRTVSLKYEEKPFSFCARPLANTPRSKSIKISLENCVLYQNDPLLILYIYLYDIFCKTMQMNGRLITVGVERVAKEN